MRTKLAAALFVVACSAVYGQVAIETMNSIFGSDFGARINMNLREDKHWSYGATNSSRRLRSASGPAWLTAGSGSHGVVYQKAV
jgi:hypothetical protein